MVVLLLIFAGCTAFQLRDANQQLTTNYYAKQQATQKDDWRMLENVRSSLNTLAADAAEQAQKETNALNQIAFYRIAATAAWQAEELDVVTYADKGNSLCNAENFKRAPRDCGMLLVIPVFAGVDETTGRLNKLQAKVTKTQAGQRAQYAPEAQTVFNDYSDGLATILEHRPKLAGSAVHPDFIRAFDQNSGKLLCQLIEIQAIGLIVTTKGDKAAAQCEVYKLKKRAFEVELKRSYADCLPEKKQQLLQPQGCP
jgi:hypothetical protein